MEHCGNYHLKMLPHKWSFTVAKGVTGALETLKKAEASENSISEASLPPCQSGTFESKNRHISKRGSPRLRKTLFQVMSTIIQHAPTDDPVFQFLDRKRREGKHYYVYMTAAANKFLRIYYGTVMAYLKKL